MGKKTGNSWLNAVKKAFRSPTNDDDDKRSSRRRQHNEPEDEEKKRGKKRWIFRRHLSLETTIQHNVVKCANSICSGEENLVRKQPRMDTEQKRAFAVAMATTAAAEAAVATAVEIIRLSRPPLLVKQDKAALLIQKIFRGYLARRALMALRGVVKLQALIRGHNVRKRAKMTLQCIQSLVRVQAIVCDQRRRLSCETTATLGSMFRNDSSRVSNSLDVGPTELEEIHALIQKAKECSLEQGKTLAHALSQQIWATEVEDSSRKTGYSWMRKDRNLCNNQRDSIKTIEVDSMFMPASLNGKRLNLALQSPKTPTTRSIPCSPCYQHDTRRMSMSEKSCPLPRPNYMAATASAMARVRPNSAPRQRQSSPSREVAGSARKRLSFSAREFEPYYGTD
ncbi:protein IQ-DOMAIN 17-like [Salvia miltiorrhiza]|uniref:protein IQ-DOMAIN 17-like n=1 Tax=Salvia miltiorrhiza TaxID=226208 RepID=UPI0025ACB0AC|nr:protein IQ-DOMAIN 17-like [Salvia miltiorrhiza]